MTTERIDIIVREDGSRVVRRNLDEIGASAATADGKISKITSSLKMMGGIIAAAGLGMLFNGFIRNTIEAEQTVAQLNAVLKSTAGVSGQSSKGLQKMASDLQDVTTYGDEAVMQMQSVLLTFTRLRGNQFVQAQEAVLNLATAMKMDLKSAALQVGKALNDPEQGLTALSRAGIQFTDDQKEVIKKLAESGKMAEAQTLILKELEVQFGGSARAARGTLGGALTALKEKFGDMLELSSGFSEPFRKGIEFITANMESILKVVTILSLTIAAAFVPAAIAVFSGWVGVLATQLRNLWILIAANPLGALLVAVTAVVTSLILFRDQIKLGIDETTTLGDLMRSVWEDVGGFIASVAGFAMDTWGMANDDMANSTKDSVKKQESYWITIPRTVLNVFDAIGFIIRGTMAAIAAVVMKVVDNIKDNFMTLGRAVSAAMSGDFDKMAQELASNKSAFEGVGKAWGDAMSQAASEQMSGGLVNWFNDRVKRAQEIGKDRASASGSGSGSGSGAPPAAPTPSGSDSASKKAAQEIDRLRDALRQLKDQADPVGASTRQLAEAQEILTKSVKAGLIPPKEATAIYEQLKENMFEQLQPLEALNREIDKNTEFLKMGNKERQLESALYRELEQLKDAGVKLTEKETATLRAKLAVEQELVRISQARDQFDSSSSAGQMEAFMTQLEGFKASLAGGGSGSGDVAGAVSSMLPWANLENTQEQMAAYIQAHADMYTQIDALRQKEVISVQTANMLKAQADAQYMEKRLSSWSGMFGALATLSTSGNRKLAAIGKAAAVAQATIDGIMAVQKALASAPPPVNYIMAAAVGAATAVNIAKIASQPLPGFRTGGDFLVGGSGGEDSRTVAFRATPSERVRVTTPAQDREEQRQQARSQRPGRGGDTYIINVPATTTHQTASQTASYVAAGVAEASRNGA